MNDGGPDNEGEVETVLAYNENNYSYNVVSNKESKDEVEESFFNYQIEDEIKVTPQTTLNPKVGGGNEKFASFEYWRCQQDSGTS